MPVLQEAAVTPYFADPDLTLYSGDAASVLRELPDRSVHMACCSPPFFGLRDYGTGMWEGGDETCDHAPKMRPGSGRADGIVDDRAQRSRDGNIKEPRICGKCGARRIDNQIGLEPSPDEWAAHLVDVFREVRRILRDDGVLFVEIGDSYDGNKELIDQPGLLKNALRADGWKHRQTIILHKTNAMPESVVDRCTTAHSYILLMVKSRSYFWDQEALREPAEWARWGDQTVPKHEGTETASGWIQPKGKNELLGKRTYDGFNERWNESERDGTAPVGKNARSVWTISTEPNALAICRVCDAYWQGGAPREHCGEPVVQHFAAFPRELVRRMILAGTSERGVCPGCGAPWVREVERGDAPPEPDHRNPAGRLEPGQAGNVGAGNMGFRASRLSGQEMNRWKAEHPDTTLGWRFSCECGADPIPATVLDCFAGSGTALLVARQLGRHAIGVELNERYCAMTRARLAQLSLLAEA